LTGIRLALCRYRHKKKEKAQYGQKSSLIHQFRLKFIFKTLPIKAVNYWLVSYYGFDIVKEYLLDGPSA
jgi:hypothetical protein